MFWIKKMKFKFQTVTIILLTVWLTLMSIPASADRTPYDWALIQLDYVRQEKMDQLERFMGKIHTLAREAGKDQTIVSFFEMNRHYDNAGKSIPPPATLRNDVEKMRHHFNGYYLANYFVFYDMLFVDMDGSIFYTLRKETDTHINLLDKKQSLGPLSDALENKPDNEVFIDFYEYGPSSEPAAFFVEPVIKQGVKVGWIILQCPINKLNSIFSATDDLGQTGETFLVNKKGLMLTESYFKGQSTILKEHLDDRNIKVKFQEKKGHRAVTDYRNAKAITSFEVFEFLDTRWLVVAKIDKDEITTDHYKRHRKYYEDRLLKYLNAVPLSQSRKSALPGLSGALRVDMDEFLKARNNEILETWGVSTCTALVAAFPKKFGYLAHISPIDRIYNRNDTDLVSQITKKIKSFDVYSFERRNIVFTVVAPHLDSLCNIINLLVEDGFFLSQINVLYNSRAKSAAIVYDYGKDDLIITWTMNPGEGESVVHNIKDTMNVGMIVEKIMSTENDTGVSL
jgi:hypothetical protein